MAAKEVPALRSMKEFLLALAVVQVASCQYLTGMNSNGKVKQLAYNGSTFDGFTAFGYHERIGIPLAQAIRRYEVGLDAAPERRISRGLVSDLGTEPYQGGIVVELTNDRESICGCSLLSNTRAVTAAHCWYDGKQQARLFTVVFGSTNVNVGGTRVKTNDVVVHDCWDAVLGANDIAMIKMKSVQFSENIQPIALPMVEELDQDWSTWSGHISGYGFDEDGESGTLRHADVTIIKNSDCLKWADLKKELLPSQMCSRSGGASHKDGDSGGPLTVWSKGRPLLVGIITGTHTYDGAIAFYIFTRISSYVGWIIRLL